MIFIKQMCFSNEFRLSLNTTLRKALIPLVFVPVIRPWDSLSQSSAERVARLARQVGGAMDG